MQVDTKVAQRWKAIVAFIVSVALGAVAQGLINGAAALWVTVIVGALTTAGVYVVRNQPSSP